MADTTFTDDVTLIAASWLNDINDSAYTPTLNARRASTYVYTAWDPVDVAGTVTNASSTSSATSAATDFVTVANASGTLTFTCVKAGIFRFTITAQNEIAASATLLRLRAALGGTGTILLGVSAVIGVSNEVITAGMVGVPMMRSVSFYATMTAAQTVTVLPRLDVTSGGVTTNFTQECSVSAEYTGAS